MRNPFTRQPAQEYQDYKASHLGAGERYHERFTVQPGRSLMWDLEQATLEELLSAIRPTRVLDFACGTGRISSFVEKTFPEPEIFGVDISSSMLDIARKNALRVKHKEMDSTGAVSTFGESSFDLILAFRFFANAEASLRRAVAGDLRRLLAPGGSLIINNHRNFWSTSYVGRRLIGQESYGAINRDIEQLFLDLGLRVSRRLSLGLWPQGDTHALLLPWGAVRALENANRNWLASQHSLGYNTIWVFINPRPDDVR